jgi:hypothetical protein
MEKISMLKRVRNFFDTSTPDIGYQLQTSTEIKAESNYSAANTLYDEAIRLYEEFKGQQALLKAQYHLEQPINGEEKKNLQQKLREIIEMVEKAVDLNHEKAKKISITLGTEWEKNEVFLSELNNSNSSEPESGKNSCSIL